MPFVSFIIPTLGRMSLYNTLESLSNQTDGDWDAIVVADSAWEGYKGLFSSRITCIESNQTGSAGLLRNEGIAQASGEWIAFVDDDDVLQPEYVEHLREHAGDYPSADVVVFRMLHPIYGVLPPEQMPLIKQGLVGISYAVKAHVKPQFVKENVVSNIDTRLNTHEDIELLLELRNKGHEVYVSPHCDYLVGRKND